MEIVEFTRIANTNDVRLERLTRVIVDGLPLAVMRTRTRFLAFPDACPHRGRQLSAHGGSATEDGVVECIFHACRFDAACGGAAVAGPCSESLQVIELIENEGELFAVRTEVATLAASTRLVRV